MGSSTLPLPTGSTTPRNPQWLRFRIITCAAIVLLCWLQLSVLPRYLERQPSEIQRKLAQSHLAKLDAGLDKCRDHATPPVQYGFPVSAERSNPRWNAVSGQNKTVIIRNVTLFDGGKFLEGAVDIKFSNGVFKDVSAASAFRDEKNVKVLDFSGRVVTPGIVDMHSHHMVGHWPGVEATEDSNEVSDKFGPLTPFVRSFDGLKPYDPATMWIASGGVTTSLILPGSANIMGGEAYPVKNYILGGQNGEPVVEEMLLEHGIPEKQRRRYMKMACGENPKGVYKHTRMGNAWILRKHMSRAKELMEKQDAWCLSAAAAKETGDVAEIRALVSTSTEGGGLPEELELDSTVAMLRGQVNINVHCYEPEDFEDVLHHSHEFGFKIRAFHHALSAWQVPEMIKDLGENITIATFAEMGLYKMEAYKANLWAGSILAKHDVPVAYKSDHSAPETFAKYLMHQAAMGHSFHLPEELALQAVTSVPARSMQADHRVGYVRPGYDADLVVWDSHPLDVGATPLQVFIDGKVTLDPEKVAETMPKMVMTTDENTQQSRLRVLPEQSNEVCSRVTQGSQHVVITGIQKSFLDSPHLASTSPSNNLTMVLTAGQISCFGTSEDCAITSLQDHLTINLKNGHILPGVTALSNSLGIKEIDQDDSTGDGAASTKTDVLDSKNVGYAKYGIHLDGKAFKRARYGGVTRAIQHPGFGGFMSGVSVAIKTSGKRTLLDGGIVADDVALHVAIGQNAKETDSITRVSNSVEQLRSILIDNLEKDSIYGRAANGSLPVAVHVENKYDIMQLIKLKQEHTQLNLIIIGGAGAPAVAHELAAAGIPVILDSWRCAPNTWEKTDCLIGPPLTKSSVEVLSSAGVTIGLAIESMNDAYIHDLLTEASWAIKYTSTLTERDAVDLVSRNIEKIFKLGVEEGKRDFVVWEGDPLRFGASVVLTVDKEDGIVGCWPDVE